jgi:hypothetical protein
MNSKKTLSPSRSSSRVAVRRSAAAAKRSHGSVAKLAAPAVKKDRAATPAAPLGKRVLQKMKTKTGMAVAAGVVLAGLGLVRKYRAAH